MDLKAVIIKEAVRASIWGGIFLIVMTIFMSAIKQNIKEGIDFGLKSVATEAKQAAIDPELIGKTKQLVKEGIEFGLNRVAAEAKKIATDPYLIGKAKQLVKEGIEYSLDSAGNKYVEAIVKSEIAKQEITAK